ncbi:MAG: type VI secretion system ATPase TssH, partial [Desulfovibrionaceae bacterium]|nr:type VI secretion system ATPase TssH [Desulfovibrionaceae bacterium]
MIGVDMKGLIDRCGSFCTQALHSAAGITVSREHYEVCLEHFLYACLENAQSDVSLILSRSGLDLDNFKNGINRALANLRSGNTGRPVFSPTLQDALEAGWLVSSVDMKSAVLRSGGVLLAVVRRPGFYAQGDYPALLRDLDPARLLRDFAELTHDSCEAEMLPPEAGQGASPVAEGGAESFIARYCEDFTAKAAAGKLDPVFGRDAEIRQMVDILARRRKNNPILVGEPGVGKTAVMEGLALRISEGDVPDTLRGNILLGLDMGLLEAGASVKGEFERRLKGVLDEIKASEKSIILFIDEAHLLVGAGNGAGGSDAANLMKPALARGEIRTCAATTWKEYKKYFEKDAALARRFQLVKLDEPSVETAALILRGLRDRYEEAHQVLVRDEALEVAADYAARYISGRFLPDKAVDLLDTACARVRVSLAAKPAALEDTQRRIQARQRCLDALLRDMGEGVAVEPGRLEELRQSIAEDQELAGQLEESWQAEKSLAQTVLDRREALRAARQEAASSESAQDALGDAGRQVQEAREALAARQGENPLVSVEVTADVVAQVVADWTGIPVGKVARDQAGRMAALEEILGERVKGQEAALRAVVEGIQAARAGLRAPEQPLGVFLLVGPSGVGKTETGLSLADALFGDESSIITINMSEFQERHTVSRLVGSPPGYVGYGEGGLLTEAVRRRPYSVVLLDEVEKAHQDVMQLFYQVFDKGILTDGEGTPVSFRNTVIMLTSNLGSEITQALCEGAAVPPDSEAVAQALRPLLSKHFQPALLARMRIVPYVSLGQSALENIATLKLRALGERLRKNSGMDCTWSESVPAWLAGRCTETETGARNIDYVLA